MSDCECGAHQLQSCSWWCGRGLSEQEIWERENPQLAILKELREVKEKLKQLEGEK